MVVKGENVALLGRDWLRVFRLDWHNIFSVLTSDPEVQRVLDKYPGVFSNRTGAIKGYQADLKLKEQVTPIFKKEFNIPGQHGWQVEQRA